MKIILPSFLALFLLMGAPSSAFAGTKKSGNTSSHKRSTTGKHRSSGSHHGSTRTSKSNVPSNPN
jgi:hypothetical protein